MSQFVVLRTLSYLTVTCFLSLYPLATHQLPLSSQQVFACAFLFNTYPQIPKKKEKETIVGNFFCVKPLILENPFHTLVIHVCRRMRGCV
jgi:hypothetical protein